MLAWAARAVAPGARIMQAAGLREGGNPWLLRLERAGEGIPWGRGEDRDPPVPGDRMQLRTQVAALALARDRGLPMPRVIAVDLSGSQAGVLALVTSVLPGSSAIPGRCPPGGRAPGRGGGRDSCCRADAPAGPAAADPAAGGHGLCRLAPLSWYHAAAGQGGRQVSELPVPGGAAVLVHGDLWQATRCGPHGVCTGVIDWDAAGAGSPGIDLGTLRLDAALYYRPGTADEILMAGGKPRAGAGARRVLGRCRRADHGRRHGAVPAAAARPPPADLDARILTARRDAFLRAALSQLDA